MEVENEIRFLEINPEAFEKKLIELGAVCKMKDAKQVRYVYDFKPADPNKWIRLRTNGEKTTLTIKKIVNNGISGTQEWEIEVSDLEETNKILNMLGYVSRSRQENIRSMYIFEGVEISIDRWPLIPAYAELEAKEIEDIKRIIAKLKLDMSKATTLDVASVYKQIYGIDIMKMPELKFGEKNENMLECD